MTSLEKIQILISSIWFVDNLIHHDITVMFDIFLVHNFCNTTGTFHLFRSSQMRWKTINCYFNHLARLQTLFEFRLGWGLPTFIRKMQKFGFLPQRHPLIPTIFFGDKVTKMRGLTHSRSMQFRINYGCSVNFGCVPSGIKLPSCGVVVCSRG